MKLKNLIKESVFAELNNLQTQLTTSMKEYITSANEVRDYLSAGSTDHDKIQMIIKSLSKLDQEVHKIVKNLGAKR